MNEQVVRTAIVLIAAFAAGTLFFGLAERWFGLNPRRKQWRTDVAHFFLTPAIGTFVTITMVTNVSSRCEYPEWLEHFRIGVASQSLVLQFLEAAIVNDLAQYLFHRLGHGLPFLWRFHAIHHSSEHVDWLSFARFHPVDQIIGRIGRIAILSVLGLSERIFLIYWLVLLPAHTVFVHSNIRLRFPILREIISTPEYHHWHHAKTTKDVNYAVFPIIDRIFGTYYFPAGERPADYGTDTPVPPDYAGQIAFPFRTRRGGP
jgi:sterol desaturase/sphingolipid hydroxylase (fatty acid hydroxylase superfamily)